MAYESVEIKNFQSIADVTLELGKFTLITGESHSGKSAFMRALVTAASNMIGVADIKQGSADMSVTLVSDTHKVTLHRTVKGGDDYFKVTDLLNGTEQDFRTLGVGGVPPEVTTALGIDPVRRDNPSINFHVQFDKPYLVDVPGSQVARELGELTNVNQIYEGVREANRRLKGLKADLKVRQKDLDAALLQVKQFRDLPVKDRALNEAEAALHRARSIERKIEILDNSVLAMDIAGQILAKPVPSMERLSSRLAEVENLEKGIKMVTLCDTIAQEATAKIEAALSEQEELHERQHELLLEAGECPTCHQEIR